MSAKARRVYRAHCPHEDIRVMGLRSPLGVSHWCVRCHKSLPWLAYEMFEVSFWVAGVDTANGNKRFIYWNYEPRTSKAAALRYAKKWATQERRGTKPLAKLRTRRKLVRLKGSSKR